MSRRAIFVLSNKGGAGKTTFARALLGMYRFQEQEVAAYDADGKVGQLIQHYGQRDASGALLPRQDPKIGCGFFDIRADDDRDVLINALADQPERLLFDLPGGLVGELGKVVDDGAAPRGLFDEYGDQGYAITVVIVMTPVLASVRTVQESVEVFGSKVNYVVVKNLAFGAEDSFILFDGIDRDGLRFPESTGKAALRAVGGLTLSMPALDARTYALLDVFNLTFMDAAFGQGPGAQLPLADQTRVRRWLYAFENHVDAARALLALDPVDLNGVSAPQAADSRSPIAISAIRHPTPTT